MKIDKVSVKVTPVSSYKGHCVVADVEREQYSIIYLTRPKVISKKSFLAIVKAIEVNLPDGFEFELEPELVKEDDKAPIKVAKK